jgi:hypothetical protein
MRTLKAAIASAPIAVTIRMKRQDIALKSPTAGFAVWEFRRRRETAKTLIPMSAAAMEAILLLNPATFAADRPWIGWGGKKKGSMKTPKQVARKTQAGREKKRKALMTLTIQGSGYGLLIAWSAREMLGGLLLSGCALGTRHHRELSAEYLLSERTPAS